MLFLSFTWDHCATILGPCPWIDVLSISRMLLTFLWWIKLNTNMWYKKTENKETLNVSFKLMWLRWHLSNLKWLSRTSVIWENDVCTSRKTTCRLNSRDQLFPLMWKAVCKNCFVKGKKNRKTKGEKPTEMIH